jgi:LEA14-like dessication related protein
MSLRGLHRMSVRGMRRTCVRATTIAAASILAAGCSLFIPKLEAPRLSVVSVQLASSDLLTQHLTMRLRVENPNDRALPIKGLSYTLEVAGEEAARGVASASFTVPPLGEAQFDTQVTANLAGTLLRLLFRRRGSAGDRIDYHLTGKVELSSGLVRSIAFDEHGSFSLR